MADDSSAQKVAPSLAAEIVRGYVAQNSIGVDQLAGLLPAGAICRRFEPMRHAQMPAQLSADHPITAPLYAERRATMAKQTGLGRAREAVVPTPVPEVIAPPTPRRGRKPRSAAAT